MKCQEVIELMQRYLDQDLDEMEYNQMLGHMQQCSECTELFQRLVALSHELEQLPKVTPAYSLVDAIMPKLQLIDMGMPVDDVPLSGHAAAPIAADAKLEDDNKSDTELVSWRKRMRGLVSTRIVGGVVAAGLVLGFFVFEQQQQSGSMKNADGLLSTSGAAQQESANQPKSVNTDKKSAISESKSDSPAASSAKIPASPANKEISKADDSAKNAANTGSDPKKEASVPTEDKSNNAQQGIQSPTKVTSDGGSVQNNTGAAKEAPVQSGKAEQEAAAAQPQEKQVTAIDQYSRASEPLGGVPEANNSAQQAVPPVDAAGGSDAHSSMAMDSTPKISPTVPPAALKQAPEQPKAGFAGPNPQPNVTGLTDDMGTSNFRSSIANTLPSPDGVYTALVNSERHVVIADQQGKTVFTTNRSVTEKDVVTLVKWESGSMLTYQISNDSGKTIYVVNVTEKTDVKK
ncbi:anti-sigma factor family protein [Paenibacillus radicis (ex Xue et al. 2023)]|uniref:Zf-HC2 domain-containing protein n=1 Tax=Paenibacillus radicis (ex Xue et al. 2023) TaxID=2972489 RepID=A0ABT1YE46_9BACL|nr:zf-HC2 domain-containing protein [Paenibacillus radicis (ex Xue et al. 2023)]MCR8631463.1 zf-HC2 domain-containing protein [Paenibacillus radicis (ex Xue et al. 2023)]